MASDESPDDPSKMEFDRIWDEAKANYQPPRHRRHGARMAQAGYEIIPHDLAALIDYAGAWFELPEKVRNGRPGQSPAAFLQISRLNGLARRLKRKVDQFLRLHRKASLFYLGQFGHIAAMLDDEGADDWPTGLTKVHLAELQFHQRSLANAMAGIYMPKPKPQVEAQAAAPTGDEMVRLMGVLHVRQRKVQSLLDGLIADVVKWLKFVDDDDWRIGDAGRMLGGYMPETVRELLRETQGVLDAYHDMGEMPTWAYDFLKTAIRSRRAELWPQGLTEARLDELQICATEIGNDLASTRDEPRASADPGSKASGLEPVAAASPMVRPASELMAEMADPDRFPEGRVALLRFMETHG